MRVYRCVSRFFCSPLKRYVPVGAMVAKYESAVRLVVNLDPSGVTPDVLLRDGLTFENEDDVRWFSSVEPPPVGTDSIHFVFVSESDEDLYGNVVGAQGPKGFQGFQGSQGPIGLVNDTFQVDVDRYGFLNQSETAISFNDSTYEFTLSDVGSGWSYYRSGLKHTISGNKSVSLSGSPPTSGTYYIYIDSTNGSLTQSTIGWTLLDTKVPVAIIRWNSSLTPKYLMADERHTCLIDRRNHYYLHFTRGASKIEEGDLDGPVVTPDVPADSDNVIGIGVSKFADEDINITIPELSKPDGNTEVYTIMYRTGSSTWEWASSEVPFYYTPSGYINYDNNGSLSESTTGRYVNSYLVYSNTDAGFVWIPGRGSFDTLTKAQSENPGTFDLSGFGVAEYVIVYQFTWQTSVGYSTKGKCSLAATPEPYGVNTIQPLQENYVRAPETNTDSKIPLWDGANTKTLKDGLGVVTTIGSPGSDTSVPTEQAVRESLYVNPMSALGDLIYGGDSGDQTALPIGASGTYLKAGSTPACDHIHETDLTFSNNTTNDTSTSQHGFAPKLPDDAGKFLNGIGNWSEPSGTTASMYSLTPFTSETSVVVSHGFGTYPNIQVIDGSGQVIAPESIVNNSVNQFTVTFSGSTSGNIIATVGSPQMQAYKTVNNDYPVVVTDRIIEVTSSGKTITLYTAVGNTGKEVIVDNSSGDGITVAPQDGEQIQGEDSQVVPSQSSIVLYSNGADWRIY